MPEFGVSVDTVRIGYNDKRDAALMPTPRRTGDSVVQNSDTFFLGEEQSPPPEQLNQFEIFHERLIGVSTKIVEDMSW